MDEGASAGKAGFLTAVYILLVPILGLFLHKKCRENILVAVALALVGLYFLCMQDKNGFRADLLLLCCALGFPYRFYLSIIFHRRLMGTSFHDTVSGNRFADCDSDVYS